MSDAQNQKLDLLRNPTYQSMTLLRHQLKQLNIRLQCSSVLTTYSRLRSTWWWEMVVQRLVSSFVETRSTGLLLHALSVLIARHSQFITSTLMLLEIELTCRTFPPTRKPSISKVISEYYQQHSKSRNLACMHDCAKTWSTSSGHLLAA